MLNGDGLRVVLWLSGCSHKCKGCQNSQTWDANSGIPFEIEALNELFEQLNKDYISGITFSGGDPLYKDNLEEVLTLCISIRQQFGNKKTIWLYSGYTWDYIFDYTNTVDILDNNVRQNILKLCDVFVDGRYEEDKRDITLKWRGSSNQRVINIEETLKQNKIILHCD